MARRRKSVAKLPLIVFSILVTAAIAVALATSKFFDPHRTVARMNIAEYRESPGAYSGNQYVVEGEVVERLAQSLAGAVYALSSDGQPLAIVIPQAIQPNFNIEKGQRLIVDIRIAEDGSAVATALSKK